MFSSFSWLFLPHRISRRFIFVIISRSLVISLCSVCVVLQSVHGLLCCCCCCFVSSNCFMMFPYVCFYVFFYPFSSVSVFICFCGDAF